MERAAVTDFAERALTTLSGGELQRVQIAIGLAQEAPVLIADEPTSQLDLGAAIDVAGLLRKLVDEGLGALVVVHDLALAAAIADRVVVVHDGRTEAAGCPTEVLTPERLRRIWGADARLTAEHGRTAVARRLAGTGRLENLAARPKPHPRGTDRRTCPARPPISTASSCLPTRSARWSRGTRRTAPTPTPRRASASCSATSRRS